MRCDLIAICPSKDVALLKATPESLTDLGDFEPLEFADNINLRQTDQVLSISHPLAKEISYSVGILSGYENTGVENEEGSQSYLQFTAPISSGSSGSPLLNYEGKVVGISSAGINPGIAQSMNYAIPTRVVLSILREMFACEFKSIDDNVINNRLNNKLVKPPGLGLILHRITPASFELAGVTDESEMYGMRVKEIIPTTPYTEIQVGDIIQSIEYADPYILPESFDVEFYRNGAICVRCSDAA